MVDLDPKEAEKQLMAVDLERVRRFAKEDLFAKVKFLVKPSEDLADDGPLFCYFVQKCGRFLGNESQSQQVKETWQKRVWGKAREDKIVANALVTRRSGVYTTMLNRFRSKFV